MTSSSAAPESCSHVLVEFDSLDPLLSALRLDSSRLKCTCLAVSRKWLALGSSGGGLNLIQREGWKQRLIVTHKEGGIFRVAICPHDEDYVAVATSQGYVVVWELNHERRGKPERIYVSSEHKGRKVTALCWDTAVLRVFVGDHVGKVTAIKLHSSKQGKAAAAFVMFPVQIITTVDSRVVQMDYFDGRLLISSLARSYLCDTEREKFWKIGNKERDGEYGACFFPIGRNLVHQPPLIYCARPGSRMWEVNFEGEVQSTHQFKQLLSSPPLPVINARSDPRYDGSPGPSQSLAFPKLLYLSEHSILTWTEKGIYIFLPQSVQVLLWSEVKEIQDVSVYKNELFCLHLDGRVSHFSLLPVERCVERLIKRSCWETAAKVCHVFQNAITSGRARKVLPVDRLEYLKAQLDLVTQRDAITQLEELIPKLEPTGSACSSRRSSITSHESFNVLDCGIYQVISRKNSQSDEDSASLHSQSLSEDERLRELSFQPDPEQSASDGVSHVSVPAESDRNETLLPFTISLPFRSTSPRVSLQAVKESVSSFVRKTTEKIGTLHMSPDLRVRQEAKEEERPVEAAAPEPSEPEEEKQGTEPAPLSEEEIHLEDLKAATAEAVFKLQDSQVLFSPEALRNVLQGWLPYLEKTFKTEGHLCDQRPCDAPPETCPPSTEAVGESDPLVRPDTETGEGIPDAPRRTEQEEKPSFCVRAPRALEERLQRDLSRLAMLCLEFKVFPGEKDRLDPDSSGVNTLACQFIKTYFFLLDLKRLKRCIVFNYGDCPIVWDTYMEGLKELVGPSPLDLALEKEDLMSSVRMLSDLEPWDSPFLLAHASRIYGRFGERAVRLYTKFFPSIQPVDVARLCRAQPGHFLAYLDNLIKSKPEEQRSSLLQSLAQPESLKLDWLLLALTHDAPQAKNLADPAGNPRSRAHLCTWGFAQLLTLLIKLPADSSTKEKMISACKTFGFWPGYLTLCLELDRRVEALTNIVYLDDMNLIDGDRGVAPETVDEWRLVLHLAKSSNLDHRHHGAQNGDTLSNGHSDWPNCITVENLALTLAKVIGPDRAWPYLQDWGLTEDFSDRYSKVCEVMKVAEKRQRALIQSMLERCERFLWSQQA
ncbi:BLOC-2 complex member HPS5 [Spea bombifrons]|uniref:BLOC-2 complex member HPS5 n=1 Tax=Spea bombifrons TaxID=233779 RepID=UPI00234B3A87|nr:BLOC-2 complex member HPS5 [Spea bombifrons]